MAPSVGPNERARPRLPYSLRPSALWKLLRNMTMATSRVQTPERGKQRRGCDEERAAVRPTVIRLLVGTGRMMWHKLHVESNSSRNCTEMSSSNCRAELKLKLQT